MVTIFCSFPTKYTHFSFIGCWWWETRSDGTLMTWKTLPTKYSFSKLVFGFLPVSGVGRRSVMRDALYLPDLETRSMDTGTTGWPRHRVMLFCCCGSPSANSYSPVLLRVDQIDNNWQWNRISVRLLQRFWSAALDYPVSSEDLLAARFVSGRVVRSHITAWCRLPCALEDWLMRNYLNIILQLSQALQS